MKSNSFKNFLSKAVLKLKIFINEMKKFIVIQLTFTIPPEKNLEMYKEELLALKHDWLELKALYNKYVK
jgi:hypothetical protein